jgi:adenylate cyclase
MSDVFISYARSTEAQAQQIAEALRALGYGVWRDDDLPAHKPYAEVIEERLAAAKAVVVIWSAEAAKSEWVQSEADRARNDRKLVQLRIDAAPLPMPFDRIQCADLAGWAGDLAAREWRKVIDSVASLTARFPPQTMVQPAAGSGRRNSICVLPFANMSGDAEQEYFSDGISEDIITDLAKVSALSVVARNTAFTFKGRAVDVRQVARQLDVGHILEGSVRKAGGRVRISAQLINGATGDHAWAERYDRDLTDIFALQDEISQAIVAALRLRLLPAEKAAIERRGTQNLEAYNLYLMARQHLVNGNRGDLRASETIVRLCRRATEIDPGYARAWALMAHAQTSLRFIHGRPEDGLEAAERALALDDGLAEAHAVRARHVFRLGRRDEAWVEIETALRLDPESFEVNETAATLCVRERRFGDAIASYEKAATLMESSVGAPAMLITCYEAAGDAAGVRRSAQMTFARAEKALAQDQANGTIMGFAVSALAALGEAERAMDWIGRALLIDPDNMNMLYNLACSLSSQLKDNEKALDLLVSFFATASVGDLSFARIDPDLDSLRDDPRFVAMLAAAEARLANAADSGAPTAA